MKTRVAAIQLEFAYVSTPQEFTDWVRAPIERAAAEKAQLIVLPNGLTLALLGMFSPDAAPTTTFEQFAAEQHFDSVASFITDRARWLNELHAHIFQSLAERTETWLMAGTTLQPSDGQVYNTALLFSPEGKIVGRQRQMSITSKAGTWGFVPGDEFRLFTTDVANLGILIGEDASNSELAQSLVRQGEKVLIHLPAADDTSDDFGNIVQSNQVFGVQANLVGNAPRFRGRTTIYAPARMTEDGSGILAQASSDSSAETVSATLDFDALGAVADN
jgi:predicted amidohydrolase